MSDKELIIKLTCAIIDKFDTVPTAADVASIVNDAKNLVLGLDK